MGKKKKVNNLENYKETSHHNAGKGIGGADHYKNRTNVIRKIHKAWHEIFDIMPPHIAIKFAIKIGASCLTEEVKASLEDILNAEDPITLYDPETIRNREKFKKACIKYSRVDYKK